MSVENRHETAEQPESREQNLEQEHSGNRESRLSDSDLDKVDDKSDNLATDNISDGHEKDANKDTDKEVSDVSQDEPDPSLEAHQQNEKEQIAEEFPEPTDTPEVNNELSNAADESDNRTEVADNERTKREDIRDVDNIDNKVETSSASEGKDGVLDEAKDFEDTQEVDPEISDPDSRKQQAEEEASIDMKDVKEEPETALESIQNKESSSDSVVENQKDDNSANEIETDKNPDEKESDEKDSSEDPDNSSIKEDKGDESIEKKNTYPTTYQEYLDSMTDGQKETHKAVSDECKKYAEKYLTADDRQQLENGKNVFVKLSDDDKNGLTKDIRDVLGKAIEKDPENQDDLYSKVPQSIKGITIYPDGRAKIIQDYERNGRTDGTVPGTRTMECVSAGTIVDRIGDPFGSYTSPLKEDGTPYSAAERAIGLDSQTENIDDNHCYHKYEVLQDLSKENMMAAIIEKYNLAEVDRPTGEIDYTGEGFSDYDFYDEQLGCTREFYVSDESGYEGLHYLDVLNNYYQDCNDPTSDDHFGDVYSVDSHDTDGIKTGEIAEMFGNDGGGKQYIFPFRTTVMCNLGLIKEI